MRSVLLTAAAVAIFASTGLAQLGDRELSELRKIASIPKDEIVRTKSGGSIADSKPLKVYLAVKLPGSDKKNLEKLVAKWNRDEGATYGLLEIVDDVSKAEVVLAEFRYSRSKPVETYSVKVGEKDLVGRTTTTADLGSDVAVSAGRDYDVFTQPVMTYIVSRENDLWTVVYAQVESFETEKQQFDPTLRLWQKFTQRVRER